MEGFRVLEEIVGAWDPAAYRALLQHLEYEEGADASDDDLAELCVMSLQDMQPTEAATALLTHRMSDVMVKGKIQSVVEDMRDEKLWEYFADMSLHERLFSVGTLLYRAFPDTFPQPDAVQVELSIKATNDPAQALLGRPLHESLLVRLLADGMEPDATLHRLFDEQLAGKAFPEADTIVWTVVSEVTAPHVLSVDVISSAQWLDPLRDTKSFESSASPDPAPQAD